MSQEERLSFAVEKDPPPPLLPQGPFVDNTTRPNIVFIVVDDVGMHGRSQYNLFCYKKIHFQCSKRLQRLGVEEFSVQDSYSGK